MSIYTLNKWFFFIIILIFNDSYCLSGILHRYLRWRYLQPIKLQEIKFGVREWVKFFKRGLVKNYSGNENCKKKTTFFSWTSYWIHFYRNIVIHYVMLIVHYIMMKVYNYSMVVSGIPLLINPRLGLFSEGFSRRK